MMTVREAVNTIRMPEKTEIDKFCLAFDGGAIPILEESSLFMDAYGDYLVSKINIYPSSVELALCVLPQKAPKA